MSRARLLRLYPRAWRDRYGQEFLAAFDTGPLGAQEVIDIVSGAIDAWLSSDVRQTTMARHVIAAGGKSMALKAILACERKQPGVTIRDGLIGAGVMVGIALLFKAVGLAATRAGLPQATAVLNGLAFPAEFTLSMPFWLMKGQPWKAQAAIVGTTFTVLVWIGLSTGH